MRGQPSVALTDDLLSGVSAALEQEKKFELLKLVAAGNPEALGAAVFLDFSSPTLARFFSGKLVVGRGWFEYERDRLLLPRQIRGHIVVLSGGDVGEEALVVKVESDDGVQRELPFRLFALGL